MRQLLVGINTILQQIPEVAGVTFVLDIYSFLYIYLVQKFVAMSQCLIGCVLCGVLFNLLFLLI